MKTPTLPTLLLATIVLVTTGCASNAVKHQAAATTADVQPSTAIAAQPDVPAPAVAMALPPDASSTAGVPAEAGDAAVSDEITQAELDAEALYADAVVRDPWEGFNRKMHGFNNVADRFVFRPVAVGYKKITPEPVRAGVSRFFANLGMPVTAVNQALQGRPGDAGKSLGRFVVNTTVGIVGVFDPASRLGIPDRGEEDFGQTLGAWGWRDSRYLVLPLLGPGTIRDTVGFVGDMPLSPTEHINDTRTTNSLFVLGIADTRAEMLPLDDIRRDALDDYLFVRDAWVQRRNHQIKKDLRSDRE